MTAPQARLGRLEAQIRPQLEVHACPARGWRPPVNVHDSHLMNRGDQCIGPETSRESVTAEQSYAHRGSAGGEAGSSVRPRAAQEKAT